MEPFHYHVFVCQQQKPEGLPSCASCGSGELLETLRQEIEACGLGNQVQITTCGSLGLCERGPNMVVYPEGVWYSGVEPKNASEVVRSHFRDGQPVERLANRDAAALRAEIQLNRDRMLAAQRARNASAAVPDELAERIRAFQESRVILTAVELDLFTAVGQGATPGEVSGKIGTDERATGMLMNALVAAGLLTKRDSLFSNTPGAARYFVAGSPDDARPAFMHTVALWRRWSTLTECVRLGTSVTHHEPPPPGFDWTQAFIAAMHRNALERAPHVIRAVGIEGVRRMLDVGGGSGAYSIAFAKASEKLHAEILDRPQVISIAQAHVEEAGLADRVGTRAIDLETESFGERYDLVLVSAICHMLSSEGNRDLVKRCYEALAPNGRIVIQDFILEPDRTAPKHAALFALNMLVGTRRGNCYTEKEYTAWLAEAGFKDIRPTRLPGPTGLMMATRR